MNVLNEKERLNSECFTYENYESNWWSLLDLDYVDSMDIEVMQRYIGEYAVGYCDGSRLSVRPNKKTYAVMFEKDGLRFWFHLEKWWFEEDTI